MFVPREKQASTAEFAGHQHNVRNSLWKHLNQVRHRLRSSWEDRTPHRSQVAAPTVLPRRRRRLSRNEPANRFACSTVAPRLELKVTIRHDHELASATSLSRSRQKDPGASEGWARCVAATCSRGLHRKAHRQIHNGPRAGTFCLSNSTLFQPRIQTVIWNTAASLCHSATDRAKQNTAGRFGIVGCRNQSCTRLQPNEFVFGGVPKDHRNLPNRILPD